MYMANKVAVGDIGSMIMYSRKFAGPINEFANITTEIQSAVAAAERIFNLLDKESEPEDAPDATALVDAVGDVEFKNVEFGYLEGAPVLKNLSFRAEHCQTVAIVGPTGAGKTTLVNLLMRFTTLGEAKFLLTEKPSLHIRATVCAARLPWCFKIRGFSTARFLKI